ncbi:hypothetical protein SPFM20_00150 [Salmonella phage SPFM20]|nr:hypothetical protein SPFM20_00150 [Salmonella phage SPFM20]
MPKENISVYRDIFRTLKACWVLSWVPGREAMVEDRCQLKGDFFQEKKPCKHRSRLITWSAMANVATQLQFVKIVHPESRRVTGGRLYVECRNPLRSIKMLKPRKQKRLPPMLAKLDVSDLREMLTVHPYKPFPHEAYRVQPRCAHITT